MATRADRELALGVLFSGRMDNTFKEAVDAIKRGLINVNKETAKMAKGSGDALNSVSRNSKKIVNEMSNVGKQISRVTGVMERLSAAFKVVFTYGIAGQGVFALSNAFRQGITAIIDFDQSLHNLKAITGATNAEVGAMGTKVLELGASTRYSAKEIADAMVILGQAGYSAVESMEMIKASTDLAQGTLEDLGTTVDLLSSVMMAFQIPTSKSAETADIMAAAINKSKLTVDKLRVAFNYVGPVAFKVGLSIRDVAAAMMVMSNSGLRASTIGTSLRQVLARIKSPSDKLRESFIRAGADMSIFARETVSFRDILKELVKIVPDSATAFKLFGMWGAPAISALTNAGVVGFDKMYKATLIAGGATDMAKEQMKGLGVQVKNLANSLGVLAIKMGKGGFTDALSAVVFLLKKITDGFAWLATSTGGQLTLSFAGIITTIGVLALALKYLNTAFVSLALGTTIAKASAMIHTFTGLGLTTYSLSAAFTRLKVVMLGHPLLFWATIIAGVAAAVYSLVQRKKNYIKNLEEEIIATDQVVVSLQNYKTRLAELEPGTEEFNSIIKAMIAEHKDLKVELINNAREFGNFGASIQKMIDKKVGENLGKQMDILSDAMKKASDNTWLWIGPDSLLGKLLTKVWPSFFEGVVAKQKTALEKMKAQAEEMAGTLRLEGATGKTSVHDIAQMLETKSGKNTNREEWIELLKQATQIQKALVQMDMEAERSKEVFKAAAPALSTYLEALYEKAPARFAVELKKAEGAIQGEMARFNKLLAKDDENSVENAKSLGQAEAIAQVDAFTKAFKEGNPNKSAEWVYQERRKLIKEFIKDAEVMLAEEPKAIREGAEKDVKELSKTFVEGQELSKADKKAVADIRERADQRAIEKTKYYNSKIKALKEVAIETDETAEKKYTDNASQLAEQRSAMILQLTTEGHKKLEAEYINEIDKINKLEKEEIKKLSGTGRQVAEGQYAAMRRAAKVKWKLEDAELTADEAQKELEIEILNNKIKLEQQERAGLDTTQLKKDIKDRELKLEIDAALKELNLVKIQFDAIASIEGIGYAARLKAEKAFLAAKLKYESLLTDQAIIANEDAQNQEYKNWRDRMEAKIKEMRRGKSTELEIQEYANKQILENSNSVFEGMGVGLTNWLRESASGAKEGEELFKGSLDKISGFFSQIFDDIGHNKTVEFKTAFKQMVAEILIEISKLIFQLMVLKPIIEALKASLTGLSAKSGKGGWLGILGSIAGSLLGGFTGGGGGYGDVGQGIGLKPGFAGGGVITEPVSGMGLKSGKFYNFAEKGPEGIFNMDQMAAMGGSSNKAPNFTLNITNKGQALGVEDKKTKWDGEKYIVDVVVKNIDNYGKINRAIETRGRS